MIYQSVPFHQLRSSGISSVLGQDVIYEGLEHSFGVVDANCHC